MNILDLNKKEFIKYLREQFKTWKILRSRYVFNFVLWDIIDNWSWNKTLNKQEDFIFKMLNEDLWIDILKSIEKV